MIEHLKALTFEEMDALTSQFTDAKIAEQIGGVSKNNVGHHRRRLGVKSYGKKNNIVVGVKGVSNPTMRKHTFNKRFFQNINSEIKAYTLGLLMADGHITKELHRVRIALTEADSYILKEIAKAIEHKGEMIVTVPNPGSYQVYNFITMNLNSTVLAQDLLNLGLTTSKDTNLTVPNIPAELECHWFRGMFDGDGYLPTYKQTITSGFGAELSGRKELLESINLMLLRHNLGEMRIRPMKMIYKGVIRWATFEILDWSYGCNPTIAMTRKLDRYKEVKALKVRL